MSAATARERMIEAGICIYCRRLARPDRMTCAACGRADSERARARYRRRHPVVRQARCRRCRGLGHDARVCGRKRKT